MRNNTPWFAGIFVLLSGAACLDAASDVDQSSDEAVSGGGPAAGAIPAGLPARELVGLFEDTGATWMRIERRPVGRPLPLLHQGLGQQLGLGRVRRLVGPRLHARVRRAGLHPRRAVLPDERRAGRRRGAVPGEGAERDDDAELLRRLQDPHAAREGVRQAGDHPARGGRLRLSPAADGEQRQRLRGDRGHRHGRARGAAEHRGRLGPRVPADPQGGGREQRRARRPHLRLGERQGRRLRLASPIRCRPRWTRSTTSWRRSASAANVTGATYDVLVGDPLDRDADYYRLVQGQNRWWDASDTASITSKSFNRYAEWLRLWNRKAGRRWVLWQIPLGNSNHRNVSNNGGAAQGYKDNRPEYFFGNGTAHLVKFADAGRHRAAVRRRGGRPELVPERHVHRRPALHEEPRRRRPDGGRRAAGDRRRHGRGGDDGCRRPSGRRRAGRRGGRGGTTGTGGRRRYAAVGHRAIQLRSGTQGWAPSAARSPASRARRRAPSPAPARWPSTSRGAAPGASRSAPPPRPQAGWSASASGSRPAAGCHRSSRTYCRAPRAAGRGPATGAPCRR